MTVAVEFPQSVYTAAGGVASFAAGFSFESAAELSVAVAAGVRTSGVHWDLTGDPREGAALVVFRDAFVPTVGQAVVINRETDIEQPDAFGDLGSFKPSMVGEALDRLTRMMQEARRDIATGGTGGGGSVLAVNGKTGNVTLTYADVGAAPEEHSHDQGQVVGLTAALAGKADLAGATFSGPLNVITPAPTDNSSKAAPTSWVASAIASAIASLGGGVTLAGSGTPAALGVAALGVSAQAARADHVHALPSLATLGAAGIDLANVTTANTRAKLLAAGALILDVSVGAIPAAPNATRASKVLAFDAGGNPTFIDPSVGGGSGVTSVNGATGIVSVTPANIAAVPQADFHTVSSYGTWTGDNVTDNAAALNAAIAAAVGRVWLPGTGAQTYYYSGATSALTARMHGPSKIRTGGGDYVPADFRYISAAPGAGTGVDVIRDFSSDAKYSDRTYVVLKSAARRAPGALYYDSRYSPRWVRQQNEAGGSGIDAEVVTGGAIGTNTIHVNLSWSANTELAVGKTIEILAYADGPVIMTTVIDGLGAPGASTLVTLHDNIPDWTGDHVTGIATPPGTITDIVQVPIVRLSGRTHTHNEFSQLLHYGFGDGFVWLGRVSLGTLGPKSGMRRPEQNKSGGIIGGDTIACEPNVYAQSMEFLIDDNSPDGGLTPGNDITALGYVQTQIRTNDTAAQGKSWIQVQLQAAAGAHNKPVDVGVNLSGPYRTGFNTVQARFTDQNAAFLMGIGQRIGFDGDVDPAGRGVDPKGMYALVWGNKAATTHMSARANNELDARGKRLEFVVNGALSPAGYGALNVRGSSVEVHRAFNVFDANGNQVLNFDPVTTGLYFVHTGDTSVGILRNPTGTPANDDLVMNVNGRARLVAFGSGAITAQIRNGVGNQILFLAFGDQASGKTGIEFNEAGGTVNTWFHGALRQTL